MRAWPVLLLLAGCAAPSAGPAFHDDFEQGIAAWSADSSLPADHTAWNVTPTPDVAHGGSWSMRFALDGRQGTGTIWAHRSIDVAGDVTVRFWVWSPDAAGHADVVASMGPTPPTSDGVFPSAGTDGGLRQPIDEGWHEHVFTWHADGADTAFLAIGINAVDARPVAYAIDDVVVAPAT